MFRNHLKIETSFLTHWRNYSLSLRSRHDSQWKCHRTPDENEFRRGLKIYKKIVRILKSCHTILPSIVALVSIFSNFLSILLLNFKFYSELNAKLMRKMNEFRKKILVMDLWQKNEKKCDSAVLYGIWLIISWSTINFTKTDKAKSCTIL